MERLFDTPEEEPAPAGAPEPGDGPLAARMRPRSLDEYVGQGHLLGAGSALRTALESGRPHSMILYGPPGTGKTTLARLAAEHADAAFEELSAVNAGRAEVRADRKSTRLNSSHPSISYAVFCLKKKIDVHERLAPPSLAEPY